MTVTPAALVDGPTRQPLPYGLFSVFTFRPETSGRWESGIEFETMTCDTLAVVGPYDCETAANNALELARNGGGAGLSTPFTVYGHYHCSPVGSSVADAAAKATQHLLSREESRVERAFWTGELGNAPALESGEWEVIGDPLTPVKVKHGVAMLEGWLGRTYGALGVIHMTREAAILYGDAVASGGVLRTPLGTPIVAGAGYPGTGPEGQAVEGLESWMYATPGLFGYRTEVFSPGAEPGDLFDRQQNNLLAVAQRTYVLGMDPCGAAAVLTDGGL